MRIEAISIEFSKILSLLVYPQSHVLLAIAAGLVLVCRGRRRAAALVLGLGFAWFYTASTVTFGGWLMQRLEAPYPPVTASAVPAADAIVLLGGGVGSPRGERTFGDMNLWSDRILFAAALYHAGKAPIVVISGGGKPGYPTEAALTRDILRVMQVPDEAMLLEEDSRDTFGNAFYTVPILQQRGLQRVLLVTSAFHMRRSLALFARQGLHPIPAPTDYQVHYSSAPAPLIEWLPSLPGLTLTHYALHEYVGYWVYRLRGWL